METVFIAHWQLHVKDNYVTTAVLLLLSFIVQLGLVVVIIASLFSLLGSFDPRFSICAYFLSPRKRTGRDEEMENSFSATMIGHGKSDHERHQTVTRNFQEESRGILRHLEKHHPSQRDRLMQVFDESEH